MDVKYLHIVAFNVPYPPDYGGIIDIYYKIRSLSEAGVRIILHCFQYERPPAKKLSDLCHRVCYYKRKSGPNYLLSQKPYIVHTRDSKSMPENLLGDPFPVLFEGLHTTGTIKRCREARKKVLVRAHNIEHDYYRLLARAETDPFTKLFLWSESRKLKRYEQVVSGADHVLGISRKDTEYFDRAYGNALYIPAFHKYREVLSLTGTGNYLLVHGNLSVPENYRITEQLAGKVLSRYTGRVVVAGKNPSPRFLKRMARYRNIRLIPDPSEDTMEQLIRDAHINLLVTNQSTGLKLKLLHALFAGRHCLVNSRMVDGTGLRQLCHLEDSFDGMVKRMEELMALPFTRTDYMRRKRILQDYSPGAGAEKILRLLD